LTIKGSVAFFLSPSGDLVHVPQNHISTVIADPETFRLTKEEIQTVYDRHGEQMGVEGEPRKELLLRIVADGWIRLRRYPNKYWSITALFPSAVVQAHLHDWATQMLFGIDRFKETDPYMPVKVSTSEGESFYTIKDLAEGTCPR